MLAPSLLPPRDEYQKRLASRRASLDQIITLDQRVGAGRLLVAAGAVALFFMLRSGSASLLWLLMPLALFTGLLIYHQFVIRRRQRLERSVEYYRRALKRLDHTWQGSGNPGTQFVDSAHPYAADLDLLGPASLFELLCTARTNAGERMLAKWLLQPADVPEIRARQEALRELKEHIDFREELDVLGSDTREAVDSESLIQWAESERQLKSSGVRTALFIISAFMIASSLLWAFSPSGRVLFFAVALVVSVVWGLIRTQVNQVITAVGRAQRELLTLARILKRLEGERFSSPRLQRVQQQIREEGLPASAAILKLGKAMRWLDAHKNQFFALPAFLLLWKPHFAYVFESWRSRHGRNIRRWVEAVGEMEALCALASYTYEHPADVFPELVEDELVYEGQQLGHPLLADGLCVRNDFALGRARVLVVSGSNMSGKSTLLRTVGTNAVLALCGAPVRATRLRLCPVSLGATLRIQDSLQAGTSRFYAEITRLREVVNLTGLKRPVLFLLDEILHGTNSHDRQLGAEMVIKGLIEKGAFGLVTTHDLALAAMADALGERAANVHFADELKDGKLVFDYKMRPGVVHRSNALELMRAVGLPVKVPIES